MIVKIIASLLHDVHLSHGAVFNRTSLRNTTKVVERRLATEGLGFLTKTLPRLGKAFDKALAGNAKLSATKLRFSPQPGSELPMFMGEFFNLVLQPDGGLLPNPCSTAVRVLRQVLYCFYKYELPYTDEQEQEVLSKFERTERDLSSVTDKLEILRSVVDDPMLPFSRRSRDRSVPANIVREARILLSRLFCGFDPKDINPRHGPGAVATKQQLWNKYLWTNVSARITNKYPIDAYFYASLGHFCDSLKELDSLGEADLPARVILVPKDSRGPRLISCEPVDFQWIQQGLGRAIVDHVENNELTKFNVFFTNQQPNQCGALLGSATGRYATLDLNEASDRVSVSLVRLLFPPHIYEYLEACRSLSTVLPDGRELKLQKFAPMGSCLCFPILALTIWAILTAAAPDEDTRESILVYGDDVIVPTAYAADAMSQLESFGLKINQDKSCTSGLFRESCGTDAFKGVNVTPVRLRTVWSSSRSASVYSSWIAYANSFYDRSYYLTYNLIVEELHSVYGDIPDDTLGLNSKNVLRLVSRDKRPKRRRYNADFQKSEYYVWDVRTPRLHHDIGGWNKLLRYFAEVGSSRSNVETLHESNPLMDPAHEFDASSYTRRNTSMLVKRWR